MTEALALEYFCDWLPNEMEYSARKAGYDRKIKRAHLDPEDETSMRGILGQEWFHFRFAHNRGFDYSPDYAKSAQQHLAKLAAGLFDKVALYNWMVSGLPAQTDEFVYIAEKTSGLLVADLVKKFETDKPVPVDTGLDFVQTPFSEGLKNLMNEIVTISADPGDKVTGAKLFHNALDMGTRATATYVSFAVQNLSVEQSVIPRSSLAT